MVSKDKNVSFDEFHTQCPVCGNVQLKANTWIKCCHEEVHEQCSECGTLFFWNGRVHECEQANYSIGDMVVAFNKIYRRPTFRRAIAIKGLIGDL
jgi:hypothetical protein